MNVSIASPSQLPWVTHGKSETAQTSSRNGMRNVVFKRTLVTTRKFWNSLSISSFKEKVKPRRNEEIPASWFCAYKECQAEFQPCVVNYWCFSSPCFQLTSTLFMGNLWVIFSPVLLHIVLSVFSAPHLCHFQWGLILFSTNLLLYQEF